MKNKYHIYIPSKGRASHCITAMVLQKADLDFTIMVEPQDYKEYAKYYPAVNLHKLKKNDQGLPYSRNSILKLSRSKGEFGHWQMDDDIRKFMVRKNAKNVMVEPSTSICEVERIFDSYDGLGVIAHRYTSFAFAQTTDFTFNNNPCSSILLRNDLDAKWNKGTVDDADFALQVLAAGWSTLIANRQLIDTVPHNQQKGGLTDVSPNHDGRHARFLRLAEDWPGGFNVKVDDNGRAKLIHRRIWSKFEQRPIPKDQTPKEYENGKMKLADFKRAKYNPRKISNEAFKALNKSIEEFGDLSGVVINDRTKTIVAGHQRLATLGNKKTKVVTKPFKDEFGTIAMGHIVVKSDNGKFVVPLRIVKWDLRKEKLANIAANNHGGEFDNQKLGILLAELDNSKFDVELTGFSEGEFQNIIRRNVEDLPEEKYTRKLTSPIYEVTGKKPTLQSLFDRTKTEELQESIREARLPKNVTAYLMAAAERHTKFRFDLAAEYYAHADAKVQELMEDCAMVIVDHKKAIEHGYLAMTKEIMDMVENGE